MPTLTPMSSPSSGDTTAHDGRATTLSGERGAGKAPREVAASLAAARRRVAAAAEHAGRSPGDVTLVVVTKSFGADAVRVLLDAGQVDIGESRAQELNAKRGETAGARWHFVGRLQRNKVRDVVGATTLIHSVDRAELATEIGDRASRQGLVQRVLVQVNAGGDPAKAGCAPDEAAALVRRIRATPGIACTGLMTIPPAGVDAGPVFARLRALRDDLGRRYPEVQSLSMGMSGDVEEAVAEGATIVRLGRAVLGARPDDAGHDGGRTARTEESER